MSARRWQSSMGTQPSMENYHTALPACLLLLPLTPASLSHGSDKALMMTSIRSDSGGGRQTVGVMRMGRQVLLSILHLSDIQHGDSQGHVKMPEWDYQLCTWAQPLVLMTPVSHLTVPSRGASQRASG